MLTSVRTTLQLWGSIAEHLTQRKADMVLLVHRLEDPAPDRISRSVPCTSSVMTGITSASQAACLESFEELLRTGTAHAEYSGRVGDCCDDEVVSQVPPPPLSPPPSLHHKTAYLSIHSYSCSVYPHHINNLSKETLIVILFAL